MPRERIPDKDPEEDFDELVKHSCCVGICPLCYPCFFNRSSMIFIAIGMIAVCTIVVFMSTEYLMISFIYGIAGSYGGMFFIIVVWILLLACIILLTCRRYRFLFDNLKTTSPSVSAGSDVMLDDFPPPMEKPVHPGQPEFQFQGKMQDP